MSTITTTAPSFETPRTSGRRILVAGAVVAGLVVAGAVAIPRLTTQTASPSYSAVTPHDAVEHRLDTSRAAATGTAQRLQSERVQRRLDLGAKQIAAATATAIPRIVERSVVQQQTGQIGHYAWTPTHISSVQKQQTGQQGHYTYVPPKALPATGSRGFTGAALQSTTQEQVGGRHATYAYTAGARSLHVTWADPWVPPYDNAEWLPYIKSHYFHPVTTRVAPTHEYR